MSRFSRRAFIFRYLRIATVLLVAWTTLDALWVHHALVRDAPDAHRKHGFGDEKIFITSIHWTDEYILRTSWMSALLELAEAIGKRQVFVSVQESGSYDETKSALAELDSMLAEKGIPRMILLDDVSHANIIERALPASEPGWIETPKNGSKPRRIPYLADQRNIALKPLYKMQQEGVMFDKILFLNDVIFKTEDVRKLLFTNQGSYAAACAMDFSRPPAFYDTFAVRDVDGHEALMQTWPYFRASASREAIKANQPAPVASCWNGMVFMDAAPFYSSPPRRLQFRGVSDSLAESHLEGSECCLINADNPLSRRRGVWLNPRVRVGYNAEAYEAMNPRSKSWISTTEIVWGSWVNRILRWTTTTSMKESVVRQRVARWQKRDRINDEPGGFCLINEMQILVSNGWAHV